MEKLLSNKNFWIPGISLLAVFFISLLFFLNNDHPYERRVLFFPDEMNRSVKGESRYLPVYDNEEDNIRLLVNEQLLGPEYILYDDAVPKNSKLNTLLLNKDKLYLDFSIEMASIVSDSFLHFDDLILLIKKTVMFNFKHIHTVNITVDGQVPYSSFYNGKAEK